MSTMSSIMQIASSGLAAYQGAIGITNTNIANADSDGYCRQIVSIKNGVTTSAAGSLVVTDMDVDATRAADAFVLEQVMESSTDLGRLETENTYMSVIEALFDESEGAGLNEALSEFWSGWQDLANDPSGDAERSVLAANAEDLAAQIGDLYADLQEVQQDIDEELASAVDEVNQITKQIAALERKNGPVRGFRAEHRHLGGFPGPAGRTDRRPDGHQHVHQRQRPALRSVGGRQAPGDGTTAYSLSTSINTATGLFDVVWEDGHGNSHDVTDTITGGVIGGCLEARDEYIPEYLDALDELASTLITEVNALLTSGYDLDGNAGEALFTGTDAGDIGVNQNIVDDPSLIAAAVTADSAPGDGSIALAVAELQNANLMNGGTATIDDFHGALVSLVGTDVSNITSDYEQQEALDEFYHNLRDAISGVSTDEESANLVLYQQGYEASAKVITVLRELMETLIDM